MAAVRFSVFHFVVHHLGPLGRFPILVQSFDKALWILTAITAWPVLREIQKLSRELETWPGITVCRHRFGGRQFDLHGVELGHVHSNGVVDIRLTRAEHDDVLARRLASPHHVVPNSSWVTVYLEQAGQASAISALFTLPFNRLKRGGVSDETIEEIG